MCIQLNREKKRIAVRIAKGERNTNKESPIAFSPSPLISNRCGAKGRIISIKYKNNLIVQARMSWLVFFLSFISSHLFWTRERIRCQKCG